MAAQAQFKFEILNIRRTSVEKCFVEPGFSFLRCMLFAVTVNVQAVVPSSDGSVDESEQRFHPGNPAVSHVKHVRALVCHGNANLFIY